jgi:hypothetical protein
VSAPLFYDTDDDDDGDSAMIEPTTRRRWRRIDVSSQQLMQGADQSGLMRFNAETSRNHPPMSPSSSTTTPATLPVYAPAASELSCPCSSILSPEQRSSRPGFCSPIPVLIPKMGCGPPQLPHNYPTSQPYLAHQMRPMLIPQPPIPPIGNFQFLMDELNERNRSVTASIVRLCADIDCGDSD